MSTRVSSANLEEAVKKLMVEWEQTRNYWSDAKARDFAHDYFEQLPPLVAQARNAVDEVDVLLRKVRHDCE